MAATLTVLILSRDRVFAEALQAFLESGPGLEHCFTQAHEERPDLVFIDASFDPADALALTWAACEWFPDAQVVILGLECEDEHALAFIEAGAAAYVLRSDPPYRLLEVLRALQNGEVRSSPRVAAAALARIAALGGDVEAIPGPSGGEPLTARELETLTLMARGLRNKEIAYTLQITEQTVKNHVHKVLEKLEVHRRKDAVRLAYRLGLLPEIRDPLAPI